MSLSQLWMLWLVLALPRMGIGSPTVGEPEL